MKFEAFKAALYCLSPNVTSNLNQVHVAESLSTNREISCLLWFITKMYATSSYTKPNKQCPLS